MTLAVDVIAQDTVVRMRDGVGLATDVVVADDGQPKPALLMRGPYSRAMTRQGSDAVNLARDGWAVVIQDSRGRFDSGGRFDPFRNEGRDGADTVTWVAAQPWCDGRVIGYGGSYLGFASWLTAREQPPALEAICPVSAGGGVHRSMMYEGDAFQLGLVSSWALALLMTDLGAPAERRERAVELGLDRERFFRTRLAGHPLRELFPAFDRWLDRDNDTYWSATDVMNSLHLLDIPVFQVAGWYDVFCEDALALHTGMRARAASDHARRNQRLVVGPWTHTTMLLPITPEFDFGPAASGAAQGLPQAMLDWLRKVLDGAPAKDGLTIFVMGSGRWRDLQSWPPPTTATRLYLSSQRGANGLAGDGRLVRAPTDGSDRFRYNPDEPVPTRGGRLHWPLRPMAGPVDQRPVEERQDVLVYTSDRLTRDLTVVGAVTAEVAFATEGRSADVTVKLVDVWPDGRAYNVLDSVQRTAFIPQEARSVEIALGSTAMCFRAGHRIRVEVSSSNFPRFDRNPSTGCDPRDATELEPAWQTVHHAESRITLPVDDGSLP
ncbi:MAG: CocE/NonD family hydrolase [Actinobacteria bacterium]|nr:CocE/NonD family hydrolase [Actinomycetota bacterium]